MSTGERRICGIPLPQLWSALLGVWLVVTAVTCGALVCSAYTPLLVERLAPQCEAQRRGAECPLCGMTTAFLLISKGNLAGAQAENRAAAALYGAFALNGAGFLLTLVSRKKKGRKCCKSSH